MFYSNVRIQSEQSKPFIQMLSPKIVKTNAQKPNCLLLIDRIVLLFVVLVMVLIASNKTSATRNNANATLPFGATTRTNQPANPTSVIKELEAQMVQIPGGAFTMGSPINEAPRSDDEVQHQVTVSAFAIGKYEVTQAQWKAVVGFPKVKIELNADPSNFKGDNLPVEQVSWEEAVEFCERLSKSTGRKYRLPTEAQWEYACRAGTTGAYAGNLDEMAWYGGDYSKGSTHPVGQKKANTWGLYDMHGNVYEWCADWYGNYSSGEQTDPTGPVVGSVRVRRGGGWYFYAVYCRSADRRYGSPVNRIPCVGFRLVRTS